MIKSQIYIRKLTNKQRQQLEQVAAETKLKTGTDILLYVLDQYLEQKNDLARLNRIIEYKQRKIEALKKA